MSEPYFRPHTITKKKKKEAYKTTNISLMYEVRGHLYQIPEIYHVHAFGSLGAVRYFPSYFYF